MLEFSAAHYGISAGAAGDLLKAWLNLESVGKNGKMRGFFPFDKLRVRMTSDKGGECNCRVMRCGRGARRGALAWVWACG